MFIGHICSQIIAFEGKRETVLALSSVSLISKFIIRLLVSHHFGVFGLALGPRWLDHAAKRVQTECNSLCWIGDVNEMRFVKV